MGWASREGRREEGSDTWEGGKVGVDGGDKWRINGEERRGREKRRRREGEKKRKMTESPL